MPRISVDYVGAVAFARSREGSVRATLTLNRLSGKAPRELARFLGISGTSQEVSKYALAVFDELVNLGVMEKEGDFTWRGISRAIAKKSKPPQKSQRRGFK